MNRLRFLLLPGSTWRRLVADVGAVVLLLAVGIVGFAATFEGATYLVAAVGALVVGIALAWVGARWRWGVLTLAGATVAVYFLLGGALALPATTFLGVIPTLERSLAIWRELGDVGSVASTLALLGATYQGAGEYERAKPLLAESARLRDVEIELHGVIEDLMRQLDAAHSTRIYQAKERLVGLSESNPLARAGLRGYRRLRGKSSRST